jgi:hypothetical protein
MLSSIDTSSIDALLESKRAVISEAYMIPDYSDEEQLAETKEFADWFQDFLEPGEDPMEPVSDIYYPILDSMKDSVSVRSKDPLMDTAAAANDTDSNLVAFISMNIYWRHALEQILPPGSDGIIVVFENPCNPSLHIRLMVPMQHTLEEAICMMYAMTVSYNRPSYKSHYMAIMIMIASTRESIFMNSIAHLPFMSTQVPRWRMITCRISPSYSVWLPF